MRSRYAVTRPAAVVFCRRFCYPYHHAESRVISSGSTSRVSATLIPM